jgi:hypothetical protein
LIHFLFDSTSPHLRDLEICPLVTSASIQIARDRLPLDLLAPVRAPERLRRNR